MTVVTSTPSEPATDFMYTMFSTPLIASSSGVATVSAITFGLAPGYSARTCTLGGTTFGYSLTGSRGMAIAPVTKIRIDKTAAKIGLSMKKREKSMSQDSLLLNGRSGWRDSISRHADGFGIDRHARHEHFLYAIDDDAIACFKAFLHDA
ncbi:hypothetical protein SRABI106_04766 [Rahnella aquatilis]|nr:hypothetical protein SRABI106_04766 [Rahnella aquatilis]